MKETAFFMLLLLFSASLCACTNQVESESLTEAKIIDENLKLKDQIADMQMEKELREERETIENEVQRELLAFFQKVMSGQIDEAKNMVTDHIEVATSVLKVNSGKEVYLPNSASYLIVIPETEWDGTDSMCMSVEIFHGEGSSNIEVYLIEVDGVWKIDNIIL